MHPPENIKRQEWKEVVVCDKDEDLINWQKSVWPIKDNFSASDGFNYDCVKTVMPTTSKGIIDSYCRLHIQLAQIGSVLPYHPFGYNRKGNQERDYYDAFFKMEYLLLGGVEVQSKLESGSIFSGRSRSLIP